MKTITSLKLYFKPERNVIIPPYSSKLSRSIVLKILEENNLVSLVDKIRKPMTHKPYVFTVVFRGDKPLYKVEGGSVEPLTLRRNSIYWFRFVILGNGEAYKVVEALANRSYVEIYGVKLHVVSVEAEVVDFKELCFKSKPEQIHFKFLTPVLLQIPRPRRLREKIGLRHILFPIPSLITYSIAKHWNNNAPENLKIPNIAKLAKISNYILVEVDYNVKPETAIYDEKRRPRGFTGWTLYKVNSKVSIKHLKTLLKLLKYANYTGIGRSRTVGFGTTQITAKNKTTPPI